jgi:hypothetical protein
VTLMMKKAFSLIITLKNTTQNRPMGESFQHAPLASSTLYDTPKCSKNLCIPSLNIPFQIQSLASGRCLGLGLPSTTVFLRKCICQKCRQAHMSKT